MGKFIDWSGKRKSSIISKTAWYLLDDKLYFDLLTSNICKSADNNQLMIKIHVK